jgi:BirA family biotin operon repressor/biotin-[acetyl-CoA-carboxylase] ligase
MGIYLQQVDSTNNYIKNTSIPKGSWVTADHQTAGRGRKDHSWVSLGADNIYFSCKISVPELIELPLLSLFVASGVLKTLQEFLPSTNPQLSIKWPNDIFLDEKKIAGILIETEIIGSEITLILGIGVNLYTDEERVDLPKAGMLFDCKPDLIVKKNIILKLVENLNSQFSLLFHKLQIEKEFDFIFSKSYLRGKVIQTIHEGKIIQGNFAGYNQSGFLQLRSGDKNYTIMDTSPEFRILKNEE